MSDCGTFLSKFTHHLGYYVLFNATSFTCKRISDSYLSVIEPPLPSLLEFDGWFVLFYVLFPPLNTCGSRLLIYHPTIPISYYVGATTSYIDVIKIRQVLIKKSAHFHLLLPSPHRDLGRLRLARPRVQSRRQYLSL